LTRGNREDLGAIAKRQPHKRINTTGAANHYRSRSRNGSDRSTENRSRQHTAGGARTRKANAGGRRKQRRNHEKTAY
jgi:hypothetical protein